MPPAPPPSSPASRLGGIARPVLAFLAALQAACAFRFGQWPLFDLMRTGALSPVALVGFELGAVLLLVGAFLLIWGRPGVRAILALGAVGQLVAIGGMQDLMRRSPVLAVDIALGLLLCAAGIRLARPARQSRP